MASGAESVSRFASEINTIITTAGDSVRNLSDLVGDFSGRTEESGKKGEELLKNLRIFKLEAANTEESHAIQVHKK
jgi:hypothetical protein